MSRASHQPPPPRAMPLPVRLADMQVAEQRYVDASPDDRMALHLGLGFYDLLTDEERFALERRYPNELYGEPQSVDSTEGTRVAWDLRARELIVCMLQFGRKIIDAKMDLVRAVGAEEPRAIMAMTATGSFLELGRPMRDGARRFVYRASSRPGGQRIDGAAKLASEVRLGNKVFLGDIKTSELLIVAAGDDLPSDDNTVPGRSLLFGPVDDEPKPQPSDPLRVAMTRFRVLVDAAENASAGMRTGLQERAAGLAREVQHLVLPEGGHTLDQLAWFTTGSGARYDVMQHGDMDLVRHGAEDEPVTWLHDSSIGEQRVVSGAPLVVFHSGMRNAKKVAFVFRVDEVGALIYPGVTDEHRGV